MGPRSDTDDAWQRSRAQLDRALTKRAWLDPVAVTVFGGVDPPGRSQHPRRDLRNWKTIQAWAANALATAGGTRQGRRIAGQRAQHADGAGVLTLLAFSLADRGLARIVWSRVSARKPLSMPVIFVLLRG
jgi:hypothetical protein